MEQETMDTNVTETETAATETESTDFNEIISDVVGDDFDDEVVEPDAVDLDGEPVEQPEETPTETPTEPVTEPVTEPAKADEVQEDLPATDEQEYTPREQALYARMKKYQERAQGAEGTYQQLQNELAELRGKVDGISSVKPEQTEPELVDPLAKLDDEDIPTAGQLREHSVYLQAKQQRDVQQQQAQAMQRSQEYLNHSDLAGEAIYDDWKEVMAPAINSLKTDPAFVQRLLQAANPAKAARIAYEAAKKMGGGNGDPVIPRTTTNSTQRTTTTSTASPNRQAPSNLNMETLTPAQQDKVLQAISKCQTDEQVDILCKRLGL